MELGCRNSLNIPAVGVTDLGFVLATAVDLTDFGVDDGVSKESNGSPFHGRDMLEEDFGFGELSTCK